MTAEAICISILSNRFRWNNEKDLQEGLATVMPEASREHRLGEGDIVDFFQEGVAVEVKIQGAPHSVLRQLNRYALYPEVKALVLVTGRTQLKAQMPDKVKGKPLHVVSLIASLL